MTAPPISDQLAEWAAAAYFTLTPEDDSGAAIFWSTGGETRLYVRRTQDGYALTRAQRRSTEHFELFAPSVSTIERYLYGQFGAGYRSMRHLKRLRIPSKRELIVAGYRLSDIDEEGHCTLFSREGDVVAVAAGDISAVSRLVMLSYFLSSSLSDLTASYRDAEGRPLFPG